ncbi:MAG: hypothetical protein ABFR89_07905 [Actinomycetota bacterium]
MSDPRDPFDNPPGWTDPYADLADISPNDPLPPLEDPVTPPATPPGSPLLTGLVVGLLLVALSVAVFQLLKSDDTGEAADTSTSVPADGSSTTAPGDTSTTSTTVPTSVPESDPYPPTGSPIAVDKMKLKSDRIHIQDNDVPDLAFGDPADLTIGRLTASFGDPDQDTGWQVSTGQWGVCTGELERIVRFGPFAAIVTMNDATDVFNGYRQDISFSGLDSDAFELETLSGLKAGDTIERLEAIYATEEVTFSENPLVGQTFELRGSETGTLLLWGPVTGTEPSDKIVGMYAPDVCNRP